MEVEDEIYDAGAAIIWVLEQDSSFEDGKATSCRVLLDSLDSSKGWCVGDAETLPVAKAWDDSPFSVGRGFDILVPLDSMTVEYTTNHGSTLGNENLTGADVLAEVKKLTGR